MREEPIERLCAFEGELPPLGPKPETVEVVHAIRFLFRPEALVRLGASSQDRRLHVEVSQEHGALLRGEPG